MVSTELNEHLPASDFLFLQYPKQKQKEVRYDKKINTLIVVQFIFLESVNRLWSCKWEMLRAWLKLYTFINPQRCDAVCVKAIMRNQGTIFLAWNAL